MDVTSEQFTTALQEAFTCYLTFLSRTQSQHEAEGKGKGVETTADLSSQVFFQTRVAVAEACLQFAEKITTSVQEWAAEPPDELEEGHTLQSLPNFDPMFKFESFLQDQDDQPFLDIFSGKWIEPVTPFSAGPSGTQDDPIDLTDSHESKHNQYGTTDRQEKGKGSANAQISPPPSYNTSSPMSSNPFSGKSSNRSSRYHSFGSTSSVSSEEENTDMLDMVTANAKAKFDFEAALKMNDLEQKRVSQEARDRAFAQSLATHWARDEEARLHEQERVVRELEIEQAESFAAAQSLADAWLEEDTLRLEEQENIQRMYAEKEKQATDSWMDWEATLPEQTKAKSPSPAPTPERANRGQKWEGKGWRQGQGKEWKGKGWKEGQTNDQGRWREAEQKARTDRDKEWEQKGRTRGDSKKKEASQQNTTWKKPAIPAPSKLPVKKPVVKVKPIVCVSCMEPGSKEKMVTLPCKHIYCGDCLSGAFKAALSSKTPFQCCKQKVPIALGASTLPTTFQKNYSLLITELTTKNPLYCCLPTCHKFIPPSTLRGPTATCPSPKCKARTCRACKKKEHKGVCKEDKEGMVVRRLGEKRGWKCCPSCGSMVEKTEGCLHITCRCKAQWCYACLRDWGDFRGGIYLIEETGLEMGFLWEQMMLGWWTRLDSGVWKGMEASPRRELLEWGDR
ncbi:hypothetical protein B0J14DRAFT_663772 [Halenospora varia]|nr:hypothetical protein B0J14DRAFT_663772 [Halenospora varia]